MRHGRHKKLVLLFFLAIAPMTSEAGAQTDYPFHDPKLGDGTRIADLLQRLTEVPFQVGGPYA